MTLVSLSIVDKSGRKVLLVISALLMSVCYASLGGFYLVIARHPELSSRLSWLPLVCIAVYISAFSIGYGPVPWVLMGEIYSSEVHAQFFFVFLNFSESVRQHMVRSLRCKCNTLCVETAKKSNSNSEYIRHEQKSTFTVESRESRRYSYNLKIIIAIPFYSSGALTLATVIGFR